MALLSATASGFTLEYQAYLLETERPGRLPVTVSGGDVVMPCRCGSTVIWGCGIEPRTGHDGAVMFRPGVPWQLAYQRGKDYDVAADDGDVTND